MIALKEETLSDLYENFHSRLGWLSWMQENLLLTCDEIRWLSWRDDQQKICDDKLRQWEREMELDADSDSEKLRLVNSKIAAIEREAEEFTGDSAYVFLGLSDLGKLSKLRHHIRGRMVNAAFSEAVTELPEWLIEQARSVPLREIVEHLPCNRFIACPFHKEKTPSFLVGEYGYCFGCLEWCDSIKWCMTQRGMSFVDAVKYLANNR